MKVHTKKLEVKRDQRGWLTELLRPEDVGAGAFGQIILVIAHPGQTRGNHYHTRKREWYCVIQGNARLDIKDRKTGEQQSFELTQDVLTLVEIPVGSIHSITNTGKNDVYILTYVSEPFDPRNQDTFYE